MHFYFCNCNWSLVWNALVTAVHLKQEKQSQDCHWVKFSMRLLRSLISKLPYLIFFTLFMCKLMNTQIHVFILNANIYIILNVYTCVCAYAYICIYMYVDTYIYIYTNIHKYIYEKIIHKGKELTGLLQLTGVSIWKGYDLEGTLC